MNTLPCGGLGEVRDASAWLPGDFAPPDWTVQLDDADRAEIRRAHNLIVASGRPWSQFGWGDFPLPGLREKLGRVVEELKWGRGFVLLRGLDVENYSIEGLKTVYWGLAVHMGSPRGQNRNGDLIGHVEALKGIAPRRLGDRGYNRPSALAFHTDFTDAVGLLCVRKARQGGGSLIVSSTTLHNHLARHRPDLLTLLYRGMHTNLRNEGPRRLDEEPSPAPVPIFERRNDHVSCFFSKGRYLGGQSATGQTLSAAQLEALEELERLAKSPDYVLQMELEPGDIQFLNCHTTLHSRSDYEDHDDPALSRLLLRLWIRFDQEDYRVSPERSHMLRWGMDATRPTLV